MLYCCWHYFSLTDVIIPTKRWESKPFELPVLALPIPLHAFVLGMTAIVETYQYRTTRSSEKSEFYRAYREYDVVVLQGSKYIIIVAYIRPPSSENRIILGHSLYWLPRLLMT